FVLFPASEALPIRAESDAPEPLRIRESEERVAGVAIPELHGAVRRGRCQPQAVRMERDSQDAGPVDIERERFFARLLLPRRGVPDPDGMVPGRRGQLPTIRAERHGPDG